MWQKGGRPWKGGNGGSGTQRGFKGGGKGEGKSYDNRPPAYVMNAIESSAAVNEAFLHREQAKQAAVENKTFMQKVKKSAMKAVATISEVEVLPRASGSSF